VSIFGCPDEYLRVHSLTGEDAITVAAMVLVENAVTVEGGPVVF
jgi:hypothetical protein